jgi:hypothetical protein
MMYGGIMHSECANAINKDGFTLLRAVNASDGASLDVFSDFHNRADVIAICIYNRALESAIHPPLLRVIAAQQQQCV